MFYEKVENPPGRLDTAAVSNAAVCVFEPAVLDFLSTLGRTVIDLSTELMPSFLGRIGTYENRDYLRDIGTLDSLRLAEAEFSPSARTRP